MTPGEAIRSNIAADTELGQSSTDDDDIIEAPVHRATKRARSESRQDRASRPVAQRDDEESNPDYPTYEPECASKSRRRSASAGRRSRRSSGPRGAADPGKYLNFILWIKII